MLQSRNCTIEELEAELGEAECYDDDTQELVSQIEEYYAREEADRRDEEAFDNSSCNI